MAVALGESLARVTPVFLRVVKIGMTRGSRSLFELASRTSHSCLHNCRCVVVGCCCCCFLGGVFHVMQPRAFGTTLLQLNQGQMEPSV